MSDRWMIVDGRTGAEATLATFFSKEQAESQIEQWKHRHEKGGRPDITWDKLENLEARER